MKIACPACYRRKIPGRWRREGVVELAETADISPSYAVKLLKDLVRAGWVKGGERGYLLTQPRELSYDLFFLLTSTASGPSVLVKEWGALAHHLLKGKTLDILTDDCPSESALGSRLAAGFILANLGDAASLERMVVAPHKDLERLRLDRFRHWPILQNGPGWPGLRCEAGLLRWLILQTAENSPGHAVLPHQSRFRRDRCYLSLRGIAFAAFLTLASKES